MVTKQQEFLETLKNPTKARLGQAVDEFYQNYCKSIHTVYMYEERNTKGQFIVEVVADNHVILFSANQILVSIIGKYLKAPLIQRRIHPEKVGGFVRFTYYVVEAP